MSEKVKAIRGSKERAEEVKQWLKEHGAEEFFDSKCNAEDLLYCVTPDGFVVQFAVKTSSYLFDIEELPRWKAKINEMYWFINDCGKVVYGYNINHVNDRLRYECGNCFRTKEEAEETCSKIIQLLKERK